MKRFRFKILIIILTIYITIISGCMAMGLPTLESYSEYISGVSAYEQYSGEVYVPLSLLTNNIEFDEALQEKSYYIIEVKQNKACYIKAIAFIVTASKDWEITFQAKAVLKNRRDITDINIELEDDLEQILSAKKLKIKAEETTSVLLFFPNTLALRENNLDKLYIVAAENKDVEENCDEAEAFKVPFKFDSMLIFFDSEYM